MKLLLGSRFFLMPADSSDKDQGESRAKTDLGSAAARPQSNGLSVFISPAQAAFAFPAAAEVAGDVLPGTVDAMVKRGNHQFYGRPAIEALTKSGDVSGLAWIRTSRQPLDPPVALRASDLICELREISGQVNRMMAQVERAIDRLAVHTG